MSEYFTSYSTIENGVTINVLEIHPVYNDYISFILYDDVFNYIQRAADYEASHFFNWMKLDEVYIHPECKNRLEHIQLARVKGVKLIIKI